jgi:O-antigen ligase
MTEEILVSRNKWLLQAALILAAATIPLPNNLNSLAIVFFCIVAFFQSPLRTNIQRLKADKFWIIPALYFLWMALRSTWDVGGFSIKVVESYAVFLFLPFVLTAMPKQPLETIRRTCFAFVIVVVLVCAACLVMSTIQYLREGDYRVFYYHYLSQHMGLNAIFLSNYSVVSIIWLLYDRFILSADQKRLSIAATIAICLFLTGMVLLLSSKMVIFLLSLMLLVVLIYIGFLRRKLLLTIAIFFWIAVFGSFVAIQMPFLHWRIAELRFKRYQGTADDQNGFAARLVMWESAKELILLKPVTGYGIKSSKDKLMEKYKEKNFELGVQEGYNSHNQFLETTLMGGVIALALLLAMLGYISFRAIADRKMLLLLLLFHFLCVSMVEATFEVQQELIFFMFFIFLFHYHWPSGLTKRSKIRRADQFKW